MLFSKLLSVLFQIKSTLGGNISWSSTSLISIRSLWRSGRNPARVLRIQAAAKVEKWNGLPRGDKSSPEILCVPYPALSLPFCVGNGELVI